MEKVQSAQEFRDIVLSVTKQCPRQDVFSNCVFLDRQIQEKLDRGLLFEKTESGVFFFEQQRNFYQVYGAWNMAEPICVPALSSPLVLDLDYSGKIKPKQQQFRRLLLEAGFHDVSLAQKMKVEFSTLVESSLPEQNARLAQDRDAATITALWNLALKQDPKEIKFSGDEVSNWIQQGKVYCIKEGDVLAGAVMCERSQRSCVIWHLAVDEKCRGKKLGEKLLLSVLREFRANGADSSWLWVNIKNDLAISFYHKVGYGFLDKYTNRFVYY